MTNVTSLENVVHDFDQMSLSEKITFLSKIFHRQRLLAKQTLTGRFLIVFLNQINNVYAEHRDDILNKLQGKETDKDILNIILSYF